MQAWSRIATRRDAVLVAVAFLSLGVFQSSGPFESIVHAGSSIQAPVDKDHYFTMWVDASAAHAQALQRRVGILYRFPAKGQKELHEAFSKEPMSQLSRRVAVVNVDEKCRQKKELRTLYKVEAKYLTFVMTDYYGNIVGKHVAKRGLREKIDVEKRFGKTLKGVENWVRAQRKQLGKKLKKAQKSFEKQDWKKAIPLLTPIAEFNGFEESEKAQDLMAEILVAGEQELAKAARLDPVEAIKSYKKIAKTFKGTAIAVHAGKARAKLEEKPKG